MKTNVLKSSSVQRVITFRLIEIIHVSTCFSWINVCQIQINTSKLKERRKKETLLDSNPQLLCAKDSLLTIGLSRNCIFLTFVKVIVLQSKAHILRRFTKIGRKVIEYSYVSGQCRQTILLLLPRSNDNVYICLFVNIAIKTLGWHIQQWSGVVLKTIA